jgi:hypothetical protein
MRIKGMKLTRPGQNGASQLIPSVRRTERGGPDEEDSDMPRLMLLGVRAPNERKLTLWLDALLPKPRHSLSAGGPVGRFGGLVRVRGKCPEFRK